MPTKTREKKASTGKTNALQKPLQPSEELAAVIGSGPLPRGQVVSKMWEYIRSHSLQNPANRREILADDKLRRVFGKDKVTMFEMNKHLDSHLKRAYRRYPKRGKVRAMRLLAWNIRQGGGSRSHWRTRSVTSCSISPAGMRSPADLSV